MPTISVFYGIIVIMRLRNKEHNPPHIHAIYGNFEASFLISNGEIYEGDFPNRGAKLVKEFILYYRDELLKMWETSSYRHLDPLP